MSLDFDLLETVPAANALAAWGITFRGAGGEIRFRSREISGGPIPQGPTTVLRNEGPNGSSSANLPLIIAFERPVRRLGLSLANGSESTRAEVFALNALGVEVARLSDVVVGSDDNGLGAPFELEAPEGETILTAVVDYGAETRAEEIDGVSVIFEERPRFRRGLAQFGDGLLPNGGFLRTLIVLTNPHNEAHSIQIGFFDEQGDPVNFPSGEATAPPPAIEIRSFNSVVFSSSGTSDPPVEGYGCFAADRGDFTGSSAPRPRSDCTVIVLHFCRAGRTDDQECHAEN